MTPPSDFATDDGQGSSPRIANCERLLLGALMHAGADLDSLLNRVRPEDYSTDAHQCLATAIRDL